MMKAVEGFFISSPCASMLAGVDALGEVSSLGGLIVFWLRCLLPALDVLGLIHSEQEEFALEGFTNVLPIPTFVTIHKPSCTNIRTAHLAH